MHTAVCSPIRHVGSGGVHGRLVVDRANAGDSRADTAVARDGLGCHLRLAAAHEQLFFALYGRVLAVSSLARQGLFKQEVWQSAGAQGTSHLSIEVRQA